MPRPPEHTGFSKKKGTWQQDVLDEFIQSNPIPKSWGPTGPDRRRNALFLVAAAINPSTAMSPSILEEGQEHAYLNDMESYSKEQFFDLFSKAPDYFLDLLTFAKIKVSPERRTETLFFHKIKVSSFSWEAKVSTLMVDLSDQLPRTKGGKLASSKEIQAFFEEWELIPKGLDTSIIGHARKRLVRQDKERSKKRRVLASEDKAERQIAEELFNKWRKDPEVRAWYKVMQAMDPETVYLERITGIHDPSSPYITFLGPFTIPLEENRELREMFVSHFLEYGIEICPHKTRAKRDAEMLAAGKDPRVGSWKLLP